MKIGGQSVVAPLEGHTALLCLSFTLSSDEIRKTGWFGRGGFVLTREALPRLAKAVKIVDVILQRQPGVVGVVMPPPALLPDQTLGQKVFVTFAHLEGTDAADRLRAVLDTQIRPALIRMPTPGILSFKSS